MEGEEQRDRAGGGVWLSLAVAASVTASLPLWRATLPASYYTLAGALEGEGRVVPGYVLAGVQVALALALALPVMIGARRIAHGDGGRTASVALLVLGLLGLLFQNGAPLARWLASLLSIPAAVLAWGGLARRAAGSEAGVGCFINGWFAGLLIDLALRFLAGTYDFIWQRAGPGQPVGLVIAAAALAAAALAWPRQPLPSDAPRVAGVLWVALPLAAVMALAGTQHLAALSIELQRPLLTGFLVAAGCLLVGWSVARGTGSGTGLADAAAAVLVLLLVIIDRTWETFTLALFGPVVAGGAVVGALRAHGAAGERGMRRAASGAIFGIAAAWLALHLGALRESSYEGGRALDALWIAVVLLGVARLLHGTSLPRPSDRWALAGILGGLLLMASILPAGPGAGTAARTPAPALRAMTYNIHAGVGADGNLDLERLARVILHGRPDVVGLQDVGRGRKREAGIDALGWLGDRLDMKAVFAPGSGPLWGVALLTRYDVQRPRVQFFVAQGEQTRSTLIATLRITPPLTVAVSRLDSEARARNSQADELGRARAPGDVIVMADLASGVGTGSYFRMTNEGRWIDAFQTTTGQGRTHPSLDPHQRRDFIFMRGDLTVPPGEAQVLVERSPASTHRPVVVPFRRASGAGDAPPGSATSGQETPRASPPTNRDQPRLMGLPEVSPVSPD